jgi:hypothetical protein
MERDDARAFEPDVTTKSALNRSDAREFVLESCRETARFVGQSFRGLELGRRLKAIGRLCSRAGRRRAH